MKMLPLVLFSFLSLNAFAQTNDAVFLKWKLAPGEVLSYKAAMHEIDTAADQGFSLHLGKLFETLSLKDSVDKELINLQKAADKYDMIVHLSEPKPPVIKLEMTMHQEDTTDQKQTALTNLMKMVTDNVALRGALYEDGTIESFYTKNDQRNLLATLFELPGKPVKVGDSWVLDVHFISMDQNFTCDTSYRKNQVTLVALKNLGTDTIAVLKYDISEFVSGTFLNPFRENKDEKTKTFMKITHSAVGEFSIKNGRWISYNGVMALHTGGFATSASTKEIRLIPN